MLTKETVAVIRRLYGTYIQSTYAFDIRLANEGWSSDMLAEAKELVKHAISKKVRTNSC